MTTNHYQVRTCKTWREYTAAEIVASAKLVTTAAGSVEIAPTLPRLNIGTAEQSGHLLHLTEHDTLLIEDCTGALCQMVLTDDERDTMQSLTDRAESQMLGA